MRSERGTASLLEIIAICVLTISLCSVSSSAISDIFEQRTLMKSKIALVSFLKGVQSAARFSQRTATLKAKDNHLKAFLDPEGSQAFTDFEFPPSLILQARHALIRFFPTGVISPTTIEIHSRTRTCLVTLSLRGRIRDRCIFEGFTVG